MGRHSHPDEIEDEPAPPVAVAKKTSAVADVQFVLHNPRVLVACFLAAAVPFALYLVVMISAGLMRDWALFLGAPLVLAGVLIGAVLDRAYGRLASTASPLLPE
jgi:hypothetical protein